MRYKSLKTRLIVILLAVGIIPVLGTVTYNFYAISNSFSEMQMDEQAQIELNVTTQLDTVNSNLKAVVDSLANDADIKEILLSQDRAFIEEQIRTIYEKLQKEHSLSVFELGANNGVVHVRGHNLEQYGDDKSETQSIQQALDGKTIGGFEYGQSGLMIRALAPIKDNGVVIGTIQIGVSDSFIQVLEKMMPNTDLFLTNTEGQIVNNTDMQDVVLANDAYKQSLKGEHGRVLLEEEKKIESYIPIYDPTGSVIIGTVLLVQDITESLGVMSSMISAGGVILLLTVIAAIIVAILYSRTLTKPIIKTAETMLYLREGDLTRKIELDGRQDEIGRLMSDIKNMQEHLHHTMIDVSKAASTVTNESNHLAISANNVSQGAKTIAHVMEEVSLGTEKQSQAVTEVSEIINHFSNRLTETTERGMQLKDSSQNVVTLSTEGAHLMRKSSEQMQEIHLIMDDAVNKMKMLDEQAVKITSFVSIIEDVANQTNLLALNASIEAARAGEHGKGFAVVAEEVKKLAEQVAESVTEITTIVSSIQEDSKNVSQSLQRGYVQIEEGSTQLAVTSKTFDEISQAVSDIAMFISNMIQNLREMNSESQSINASVQEISAITEETSASIEETSATIVESSKTMQEVASATEQLSVLANELNAIVKQYKI